MIDRLQPVSLPVVVHAFVAAMREIEALSKPLTFKFHNYFLMATSADL